MFQPTLIKIKKKAFKAKSKLLKNTAINNKERNDTED